MAVLGVVVALDAAGLPSVQAAADPIGSRPVPFAVSALLIGCAVALAVDVWRGGRGELEGGEDVDLSHGTDWPTVGLLLLAIVANIVLIDGSGSSSPARCCSGAVSSPSVAGTTSGTGWCRWCCRC